MRIKVLRDKKVKLLAEAQTLTAKEDAGTITADETARLEAITKDGGEIDQVNAQIAREEKLMDERRSVESIRGASEDTDEEEQARVPAAARPQQERFASLGEMLIAVAATANGGARDRRLQWETFQAATGQSEGVGAEGGFLVQTDFTEALLARAYERSDLASRVRNIPISGRANGLTANAIKETSRANGSRFGGIQAFWTGEGQEKLASTLKFREMTLKLHKLTGLLYATDELLEDAAALEAIITMAFEEEFAFKLDWAIFEGTGAGMPLGFMNSAALISVAKEGSQTADTIVTQNVLKMWARMWSRSRKTAVWLINQSIEPQLMGLTLGDKPIWLPPRDLADAPNSTLLGRPVIPTEFNSQLGDKGDIVLADPNEYLMIRKGGVKKNISIHVRFVHDETAFRFVVRVDGQPIWESPMTPFKGTDTVSPFVTLDERA